MQVILTKDVKGLGLKGDAVSVSDGHARNYLMPRKLAIIASDKNLAVWEQQKKKREEELAKQKDEKAALAEKLKDTIVPIQVDVGESGRLFGSVTSADVALAIKGSTGVDVDKKDIDLPEHIKLAGVYEVAIKLHPEVTAKVRVDVKGK